MYRKCSLVILLFLVSGCAYLEYTGQWPPPPNIPPNELIYLEPNRTYFSVGEEIKGVFRNTLSDTVFIIFPNGGGDYPLRKWNGENWEIVNTRPKGVGYTQSVILSPLERWKTRTLTFPESRLRELEKSIPGKYRFAFSISYDDKTKTLYSQPFTIERHFWAQ